MGASEQTGWCWSGCCRGVSGRVAVLIDEPVTCWVSLDRLATSRGDATAVIVGCALAEAAVGPVRVVVRSPPRPSVLSTRTPSPGGSCVPPAKAAGEERPAALGRVEHTASFYNRGCTREPTAAPGTLITLARIRQRSLPPRALTRDELPRCTRCIVPARPRSDQHESGSSGAQLLLRRVVSAGWRVSL